MKIITLLVVVSLLNSLSFGSEFTGENLLAQIKESMFNKQIESISEIIDARNAIQGSKAVEFMGKTVVLHKFKGNQEKYKNAVKIEFAKNIKVGDFYGNYRIIKYKNGKFSALYHSGNFGDNQYMPCFCKLSNEVFQVSGHVRISSVSSPVDNRGERLLVFRIPKDHAIYRSDQ